MLGDVTAKVMVILAGLIACGVCAAALIPPAVDEADEGDALEVETVVGARPGDDLLVDDRIIRGDGAVVADPVVGDPVVGNRRVVAPALADEPEEVVIPGAVIGLVLVVGLILTGWALLTPAVKLARPALIAGLCVLVGTLLAWGLGLAGVSEYPLPWEALAAWLSVAFSLLGAWLILAVLSGPGTNEAVPA